MRTSIKKSISLLLVLSLALSLTLIIVACDSDTGAPTSAPPAAEKATFIKAADSEDGYATVYVPNGRDLKIMVLSDPQVDLTEKYSIVGSLGNEKTYEFIEDLVASTSPDLVIINGDMVMANVFNTNNAPYFKRYADIFEKLEIPWMPVFGNHDCEQGWVKESASITSTKNQVGKAVLVDYLSSFDHCLMSDDEACEDGVGNYFVNVRKPDGSFVYTLCALDCVYNPKYGGLLSDSDTYIVAPTAAQVDWYRNTINTLSNKVYGEDRTAEQVVKSMIFNHVGLPEFYTAWKEAWNDGNPTEDYFYGRYFSGDYSDAYGKLTEDEQLFSAAKALGSTTAIFMCHHHDNDFSVNYQGIRLTFGQHSGVSHNYRTSHKTNGTIVSQWTKVDFSRIDNYGNQRGGTEVTISADKAFDIQPVYAQDVIPSFAEKYYIDYDQVAATLEADASYADTVKRGSKREWKITTAAAAASDFTSYAYGDTAVA